MESFISRAAARENRVRNFFVEMVRRIFEIRERENIRIDDFIGRLKELRDEGIELTDNMKAAQVYMFFTAGADTTAITLSNALYEIAVNPHIQEKLRHEINEVLKNEKLKFGDLKEMEYLNLIFKETLRKYALRNITRKTTKPYTLPNTNITIPENTQVVIPQYAIQRDHRIYAQPDVFDPERFVDEKNMDPMNYIPFGNGPRKCVGELFAHVISKTVIVNIVKNFELETIAGNRRNENDPRKVFLFPKDGIRLRFKKL